MITRSRTATLSAIGLLCGATILLGSPAEQRLRVERVREQLEIIEKLRPDQLDQTLAALRIEADTVRATLLRYQLAGRDHALLLRQNAPADAERLKTAEDEKAQAFEALKKIHDTILEQCRKHLELEERALDAIERQKWLEGLPDKVFRHRLSTTKAEPCLLMAARRIR